MCRKKYSSPEAGGGVHGRGVGTAPDTMTEGGVITRECQVFTDIFMRVGEMISGIIGGKDNRGNISGYLTVTFIAIGVPGKKTDTGVVVAPEDLVIPVEDLNLVTTVGDLDLAIREMEDDKRNRIEDKAAKRQTAA
jgi:hypothetical protein